MAGCKLCGTAISRSTKQRTSKIWVRHNIMRGRGGGGGGEEKASSLGRETPGCPYLSLLSWQVSKKIMAPKNDFKGKRIFLF